MTVLGFKLDSPSRLIVSRNTRS